MTSAHTLRNGYDVFISHNHEDKVWTRELAERLSMVDYNGRPLRPWLDEHFLDPGNLGKKSELTTALDRARILLLVLSPASVASKWVEFELEYFLRDRQMEKEVVVVLKRPCEMPQILRNRTPIDFTEDYRSEIAFSELVERLCPRGDIGVDEVKELIEHAWSMALEKDPGGLDAKPTPERDALLKALLRFAIDDPISEGLALTGFLYAGRLLLRDHERDHPAAYNMKMCLGECLAVALLQSNRYRQVTQQYLDLEGAATEDPVLAFVVVRAYSILAEIEPDLIDMSIMLRVATQLDAYAPLNNKKASLGMLVGFVAAKIRNTDLGDLLIQTLSEGGAAGRIAAIGGISVSKELAPSVFYVSELAAKYASGDVRGRGKSEPPSRKLQALLFGIDLDQPSVVRQQLELAKDALRRTYAIEDLPYGCSWFELRNLPPAASQHRAPFMGTVVKATRANMEELALQINASHVVCLTESRIVESLFDRAGSILIPLQEENMPQFLRLNGRSVPFALLDEESMATLTDGDHIVIEGSRMRIVSNSINARTLH